MADACKVKDLGRAGGGSAFGRYRALVHGDIAPWRVWRNELLTLLFMNLPGALGLALRQRCYPCMFRQCGRGVVFGRGVTLRHAHKIALGEGCIIDDGALLDAKGSANRGIELGNGVYIGRNTNVYCKNGDIVVGDRANFSANCTLFSSNRLSVGAGCMVGAYCYFLSGGEYDYHDATPFADQSGMCTRGPLEIGADCWFGARVTVLDAACIGQRCVIGAGAVVTKPVPDRSLALGVPAKPVRQV
ncbi:MAG: acyltransferase [Kiritimatiellae bacterium]|nr:acyltransferase [Kiritimatiellia bacterium]